MDDKNLENILAEITASLGNLSAEVPQHPNINLLQSKVEYEEEIEDINAKAEAAMIDSRAKLIGLYVECERQRLAQQEPILKSVISINKLLIWLFNIVIVILSVSVVVFAFVKSDVSVLQYLLDFLKYYIGAVVVELIGMLFFIVRGVFSSDYQKIMESVLKTESK